MTSPAVTCSRSRDPSPQEAGTAAAAAEEPPPAPSAAAATAAASEAGPSRRKRPLESQESPLSEDDYSCPICLNLLLDPVVSACGHDCCQLCLHRWTVDQGKRSCPVCRAALGGGPAAPLPGVCLRLQRTLEQLFPERIKERQEEVAEQKRQLAEERRRRAEAARRQAAERAAASSSQDRLMQAILEHLLHEHMGALAQMSAGGGAPGAARTQQAARQAAAQQAQQAQQRQQPVAGRRPGSLIGQAIQAEIAARAAADAAQQAQQQAQQQQGRPGPVGRLLSSVQSLFGSGRRGSPAAAPSQQAPAAVPGAAGQPEAEEHAPTASIELQFEVHLLGGPQQAQVTQLEIPLSAVWLPRGAAPAGPAARAGAGAGGRGGSSGGSASAGAGSGGGAAWPEGPPLEDMQFEMGWGEQNRRRRSNRGSRSSGDGGSGQS